MANNPNITSGDMYYIQLDEIDHNQGYYRPYRKATYELGKCASWHSYNYHSIPGESDGRAGCNQIKNDVSTSSNFKLWI